MKNKFLMTLALITSLASTASFGNDAQKAENIARVSAKAQVLVNKILARNGGSQAQPGVQTPGGTAAADGIVFPWETENDFLAYPIFMQASGHLNFAAQYAFESQAAFLSGNINLGLFKFTSACSRLSIGKSALARANLAAIQPPMGLFGVFNAEVMAMLSEIQLARTSNGCL